MAKKEPFSLEGLIRYFSIGFAYDMRDLLEKSDIIRRVNTKQRSYYVKGKNFKVIEEVVRAIDKYRDVTYKYIRDKKHL